MTQSAPTYGQISNNTSEYVYPTDFERVYNYIYPYINSTNLEQSSGDPNYGIEYTFPAGGYDASPQPYLAAGSDVAPGGNEQLYDVLFTVTADITNSGDIVGEEVPQLYISLGGPNDPKVQLRGFDRLSIAPGQTSTFTAQLCRRDISNWDTVSQNWVISNYTKTAYVGSSSRKLPLQQRLNLGAGAYSRS